MGNKLKEYLREIFNCALKTQAGRSGWWIRSSHSVWQLRVQHHTSTGTAGCQDSQQIWSQRIQEALLLREGPKGSGWNGDFQRALQHRTSVWQHHSDQEGAHRCGSTPKILVGLTDLGKQSYLLRRRGKFLLVLPLPVKGNSAENWPALWPQRCEITLPIWSPQWQDQQKLTPGMWAARWNEVMPKLSTGGKRPTLVFQSSSSIMQYPHMLVS